MKLTSQTVYSKALAIYVAMSFLLGIGVVSLTQTIIVREFRATERREMLGSLERLQILLERELVSTSQSLSEWVSLRNGGVADARDIQRMNLDFLAFFGPDLILREVVSDRLHAPPASASAVLPYLFSIRNGRPRDRKDFVVIQDQLAFMAWEFTQPGNPLEGIVVAIKKLDGASLRSLETLLGGKFDFEPLRDAQVVLPGAEALVAMLSRNDMIVEPISENEIQGQFLVRGPSGDPLGIAKFSQARLLEAGARTSVRIFLTVLALAGGVLFIAVWFLLDRTILRRIRELTRQVEAEQAKGLLPVKLEFSGNDELGLLARRIESLATQLAKVQSQYRQVVEDQTESICRFNEDFAILFSNEVFRRTFRNPAFPLPTRLGECLPQEAMELLARRFNRLYPTSPVDTFQHVMDFGTGQTTWFRSTLRRNFLPNGTPAGGQWVAADVTLQVEAEQSVQESERQLRRLSSRLLHLQDDERRRIARELHDSTAQNLSALEMNVSLLDPLAQDDRSRQIVAETRRIARDCCQELRNISYLLHPPLLDEVGLPFAMRWFVDGFVERTGIAMELEMDPAFPRFDQSIETALFRIVQEAASNIYRHAETKQAVIHLHHDSDKGLSLTIRDYGRGFPETGRDGLSLRMGIGLAGMRERITQLNGVMEIKSSPHGVMIAIIIPKDSLHGKA